MARQGKPIAKKDRDQDQAIRKQIGSRIKKYRAAQNLTQEALADKVGRNLSINSLSRYETGETEMGVVTYLSIAAALGVRHTFTYRALEGHPRRSTILIE